MRSIHRCVLFGVAVVVTGGPLAQEFPTPRPPTPTEPANGSDLERHPEALTPATPSLAARVVAAGITSLRDSAIERGVEPVPANVRDALIDYLPADLLDSVRWRIDDGVSAQHTVFALGDTPAMTLGHVIVFARAEAARDVTLWAHELWHAMQFRRWGVDGFAERYLADYGAVELEAAEFRWQWMKATGRTPQPLGN